MEGKQRLLQLLAFTNGPAIDVVQQYFEFKIIPQGTDFEDYLNDFQNKHKLFHERYPKIPCCECLRTTSIAAPSKRGCLGYQQFSKLYDENGTVTAGHEQINRSKILQHCICKVSAQKSIKVIDIDLTLLNAVIQHCCNLHITTKIAQWMKVIKEVRDTISHLSEGKLEKIMFEQTWKKLEKATLQCAGDIGHTSVKIFQMTIDLITTCSVDKLEKQILQTTDKLSEVHDDLNGIIPTVKSVLSKQIEQSKDLTEVKNLVSGVNTVVEQTKDVMEKVNIKTEESTNDFAMLKEDIGNLKYMVKQIGLTIGMTFQRQEEIHEDTATGKRKSSLTLDVEATSTDWDEKKTTLSLKDKMQAIKERVDNDHHDDTEEFIIEKVENKCIHLELSASRDVFGSPQKLRIAIKSLIDQFVKAAELDGNVPATINMNITVKSALTTEEKKVVLTVFSDNDILDGSDYNEKLQIEHVQEPRILVKPQTVEPDQQMASNLENLISVNLENIKFNLEIKGLPHSLSKMVIDPDMNIEESIDFSVIWTWHFTQKEQVWDVISIVDTINSRKLHLRNWFRVEDVKIDISGRLALQTTTPSHTFCSRSSLETAVTFFLGKFIKVCDIKKYLKEEQTIKLDVTNQLNKNNDDKTEIMREEMEKSVDTILTCDDCKNDLICLVCKTSKSLISRLDDKLKKQRNTIMRYQRRMSTLRKWIAGWDDDVCSSDDEKKNMGFDDSVFKKRKKRIQISTEPQEKDKALKKMKMSTTTEDESSEIASITESEEFVFDREKAVHKLMARPLIDNMTIRKGQLDKETKTPAKPSPLYENQRLNLSKFLLDRKHFSSSKDEQTKAEDMYKQLMGKEKELADMLKEKVPVSDMPSNFTLKDFADQVKSNYLTKALKLYFNNGNNKRAAWDYITLTQSAMELDGLKSKPANIDCGVTSAQTSFRKCVFCDNNAVFFCYQCKAAFCQLCRANYHDKLPVSKDHSVKDLKSVNPSAVQLVCSEHKAEYTYYCVSCKTLVCSSCVTTAHTGHEMSEIKGKAEEIKKIAKSKLFNMKEKLQRLSKLVEKTKSVHIPNLDEESEDAITSIRTIENDLHNIIKTKADIKTNEIEDKQQWTKEELQSTYHNNSRTFHKQTAVCDSLATLLSEEHAVSFLVSYQTLERDLYELTGEILEDTEPNAIKPPDLVAFLDEIVYSIDEYKKRLKTDAAE